MSSARLSPDMNEQSFKTSINGHIRNDTSPPGVHTLPAAALSCQQQVNHNEHNEASTKQSRLRSQAKSSASRAMETGRQSLRVDPNVDVFGSFHSLNDKAFDP